jgi:hypothetical protein
MTHRLARLRAHLSYANVAATLALFIALGGTSYAAATLARNSVGSAQIRANAVGASEIRTSAVRSREIRDRTIALRDIAPSARNSLRGAAGPAGPQGPAGPAGVALTAAVNTGGQVVAGNARAGDHAPGTNEFRISFNRDVAACVYSATLAAVQNGPTLEQPPAGRITVSSAGGDRVLVKTFDAGGAAVPAPFHLMIAC